VRNHPYSVVLLDEIEKAHPDLFNILLQVMDHATLTDNNGRKADFRNVILVMTTNAGASETARRSMGFTHQDHSSDSREVINRLFSPEFRNRLDAVIQFKSLANEAIAKVVDKFLFELEGQLTAKGVRLLVDDPARVWLAARGYDPQMGARPMARLIQEQIKKPLANELLFGSLTKGGLVRVSVAGEALELAYEATG
jgi:ATP-dependent Clp protease ATP-binding subunit ClpA